MTREKKWIWVSKGLEIIYDYVQNKSGALNLDFLKESIWSFPFWCDDLDVCSKVEFWERWKKEEEKERKYKTFLCTLAWLQIFNFSLLYSELGVVSQKRFSFWGVEVQTVLEVFILLMIIAWFLEHTQSVPFWW